MVARATGAPPGAGPSGLATGGAGDHPGPETTRAGDHAAGGGAPGAPGGCAAQLLLPQLPATFVGPKRPPECYPAGRAELAPMSVEVH